MRFNVLKAQFRKNYKSNIRFVFFKNQKSKITRRTSFKKRLFFSIIFAFQIANTIQSYPHKMKWIEWKFKTKKALFVKDSNLKILFACGFPLFRMWRMWKTYPLSFLSFFRFLQHFHAILFFYFSKQAYFSALIFLSFLFVQTANVLLFNGVFWIFGFLDAPFCPPLF